MFNKFFFALAIGCTLFTTASINASAASPIFPMHLLAPYIIVPSGTAISVKLNEQLPAEMLSAGNAIEFKVQGDVRINNLVVVKHGDRATGMIKSVATACSGKCSQIVFTVDEVQAIDGQMIPLNATPHVLKAPCCTGEALATIGTLVRANTLTEAKVKQD
jgi:hypothetical protein